MKKFNFKFYILFIVSFLFLFSYFYCAPSKKLTGFRSKLPSNTKGKTLNHTIFNNLLKRNVTEYGYIYYNKFRSKQKELKKYQKELANLNVKSLTLYDQIATYINAYNVFTIQLILNHYPLKSIKSIPANKRWKYKIWNIGGKTYSLDDIEHSILRGYYKEPRIHFAVVCASDSCPILLNRAYKGYSLDRDLNYSMYLFLEKKDGLYYNKNENTLYLSKIMSWYKGDFISAYGSLEKFLYKTLKQMQRLGRKIYTKDKRGYQFEKIPVSLTRKLLNKKIKIAYSKYSWKLNGK